MNKPQIGQKVYLKPINDTARGGNKEIKERKILRIGRKYLEVWNGEYLHSAKKFHLDTLKEASDYSPDYQLYFSRQDIVNEEEAEELVKVIRNILGNWGKPELSLDQLRRIHEIIKEGN